MIRYEAKNSWLKKFRVLYRASQYASGIRACYKYDSRVRDFIDRLPDGFDICVGILGHGHPIVITKIADGLHCKVVDAYAAGVNSVEMLLKNLQSAEAVLTNKKSFKQAYAQRGLIMRGELTNAVDFINTVMIIQSYMATSYKRRKYMDEVVDTEVPRAKVRAHVFFRGWLL